MFFAKIPRHTSQNAITEGDLECILTRNCEGTEQLQNYQDVVEEKIFLEIIRNILIFFSGLGYTE